MSWIDNFLLGRPGNEYEFEVNPETADVTEKPVSVLQRNLAGDLKKSVLKSSVPSIKIASKRLSQDQQNIISSLARVSDTFLSFRMRDDMEVIDELVAIIDSTHVRLPNTSATRLSKKLVELGLASTITIQTPWNFAAGGAYGGGSFGAGAYGGVQFDPGTVTYDDLTRIIEFTNPVDVDAALFVSYLYEGWLVDMKQMQYKAAGPFADLWTYDIQLEGA